MTYNDTLASSSLRGSDTTGKVKLPSGATWGSIASVALALGIGVLGVVMAHYPMIASGFRRIQTDPGDTRLIHYLLEHGYRWMRGEPGHGHLWSPPFFYPAANAAAYSDLLLTVGPVYWLWRAVVGSPDVAFGLWMVSMSVLNYAAGLLLFRKGFGFGMPASVAGASLVAFGAPRVNQMGHQQLLPCFFVLLAAYALSRVVGDRSMSWWARAGYWLLAAAAVVAQLYGGVYLGWFLLLGLGIGTVAAVLLRSCRPVAVDILRRDFWAIVAAGTSGLLLLQPFLSHYLPVARELPREYHLMLWALHPTISSWLNLGPDNWFWGWMWGRGPFVFRVVGNEHYLGIGFLTLVACAAGFFLNWQQPISRLAVLVAGLLWMATTVLPGNDFAMLAAWVCFYCGAGLFFEIDHPRSRGIALAVVLGLLLLSRFPNPYIEMLGLMTMILCLLEIARLRDRPQGWIVPGLAIAALSLKLFPLYAIAIGVVLIAPVAGLLAYYFKPRRWEIGLGSLAVLLLFLFDVTFLDKSNVLIGGLVAAPISLAMAGPRRWRPPAWLLLRALLIALAVVTFYYHQESLWLRYFTGIPGANAMRAVGRIVLILLIPAALGLAFLAEFLERRGWAVAGWVVALVCLAEQGVTTATFDAEANRATIMNLARRIDRGRDVFYYHPCDRQPIVIYQLDAMWASLATRLPTINGYSGHFPRDWAPLFYVDSDRDREVADVLADWEREQGLSPDRVQWIGADCPSKESLRAAERSAESAPAQDAAEE